MAVKYKVHSFCQIDSERSLNTQETKNNFCKGNSESSVVIIYYLKYLVINQ